MFGNLSQTVVKIPKLFKLMVSNSSSNLNSIKYREELSMIDTFNQIKNVNTPLKNRFFRVIDHFKENSPYKLLNYNNNKRFISPVTKEGHSKIFHNFIESNYHNNQNKKNKILNRKNSSVNTIIDASKYNIFKNSTCSIQNDNIKVEVNSINSRDESFGKSNVINKEGEKMDKIMNELKTKKPQNINELKELLNMNYISKNKNYKIILPKINESNNSISGDTLFLKSLEKKIESLTTIKPSVKTSLHKRKNKIFLKKDYDLFQKLSMNQTKLSNDISIHFNFNSKDYKKLKNIK